MPIKNLVIICYDEVFCYLYFINKDPKAEFDPTPFDFLNTVQ